MLRKTVLLCVLLLSACEPSSSPAPNIVSIEPEEVMRGETATIALELDAPLPVKVDYGKRTATLLGTPTLRIGGQEVTVQGLGQDGRLLATVPADLTEGLQDVQLELGDGSGSIREQGLTVLPPPPPPAPLSSDGGVAGPLLLLTGIQVDPIPDQVRGVPFDITLRVDGPEAATFQGQVLISTNKGRVTPNMSGAFTQGVRQEQVVLDKQGGNVILTVRLGDSLVAQSNPFKVSNK
ncbi:hypothetical protein [Archangium lipolyticum]|uniref:hypothetical protein n=1 Tax=Archangium lipolyticum TaxID=2970465 RepID=UPI00214A46C8|nr:hypothetical protein [Archangium lipolyticum]